MTDRTETFFVFEFSSTTAFQNAVIKHKALGVTEPGDGLILPITEEQADELAADDDVVSYSGPYVALGHTVDGDDVDAIFEAAAKDGGDPVRVSAGANGASVIAARPL